MKFSLSKNNKLTLKANFENVRHYGEKYLTRGIVILIAKSPDDSLKCGIICSRKYSVRAVKRNRARRILWESFRLLKPQIKNCWILMITRQGLMNYKQQEAMSEIKKVLKKANLFVDIPSENI